MNDLKVFNHNQFGELEILLIDGKEFFPATDVSKKLGYSNANDSVNRHCKRDGVVFHEVIDSLGRKQQKKFINEGNLYRLIVNSKLPEAEKFESWVFDEVLPTIRKTGSYNAFDTSKLSPELQMFKKLFDSVASAQLAQAEQAKKIEAVEIEQNNIKNIIKLNPKNWRKEAVKTLRNIAWKRKGAYQEVYQESYEALEDKARCDLSVRLTNKRSKMALAGASKAKIDKVNKLDVIEDDPRLTEIYISVIKQMAIKYDVDIMEVI